MVHETHGSTASQCVAAFCPDERHAGGVDVDNASLAMHRDGLWQGLDQQPERREDDRRGTDGVLLVVSDISRSASSAGWRPLRNRPATTKECLPVTAPRGEGRESSELSHIPA